MIQYTHLYIYIYITKTGNETWRSPDLTSDPPFHGSNQRTLFSHHSGQSFHTCWLLRAWMIHHACWSVDMLKKGSWHQDIYIYGRYLRFRFLKCPLIICTVINNNNSQQASTSTQCGYGLYKYHYINTPPFTPKNSWRSWIFVHILWCPCGERRPCGERHQLSGIDSAGGEGHNASDCWSAGIWLVVWINLLRSLMW